MDFSTSNGDAQNKSPKRRLALIIGLVLAVTAAVIIGVYTITPGQIIVPDLRGKTLSYATAKLQALHLSLGRKTVKGDPAKAIIVLAQFPSPATAVRAGSAVDLVLSEPVAVGIPSLVGKSLPEARRKLTDNGLQLGGIEWRSKSRTTRNTVLRQFPAAGTRVEAGSKLDLVVSGTPDRTTQMAARSMLESRPAQGINTPGQTANIGGSWRDAGGAVVRILQNGSTLQYSAHSTLGNCQGSGVITGVNFRTSYSCATLIGSRSSGRCAGIVSGNGNIFHLQCADSVMGRTNDVFTR